MANYEEGSIVEGKVTGIKPFGAFVAIDEKKQGLVHISEVAHGYVKDIADVLAVGDEVKVKIMSVDEESGKISLSIRATQEAPARPQGKPRAGKGKPQGAQQKQQGFNTLEDKLKEWLKQSNEIQADLNKRAKK
ncbi:S1 domain-containing post-transcriptional regulator GSP13 [Shouchella clausii]|jgi:general stress protein 13|uniref:Polyribonucleotide nucleotidyltransferase n=2 Tax=Shouchella clausii TaxID=79880 RepID=Q5WDW6_SHOC1|nr:MULTISPECIES: S1 domain-containing post-transcriptional regulator GSP13 [Shouchella]MCM3313687.1 S1 domain-containing post-transcriptional regulator GSP13 [Psychrobacillus sp. MER TA 17]PAD40790.1 RNA-binding protein S1 [Bacillus sp. 7520-S]SPT80667.1 general stress protein 13 [Niallia circulans]ALA54223.1 SSU ribosomal protein S1p [Shouchella clausii]AST96891.1 RNA-binding protein S1 [Shouchella clausii]